MHTYILGDVEAVNGSSKDKPAQSVGSIH